MMLTPEQTRLRMQQIEAKKLAKINAAKLGKIIEIQNKHLYDLEHKCLVELSKLKTVDCREPRKWYQKLYDYI